MSVDISHRNLARLSTADDVCSRRKMGRGESPRECRGDGKWEWGVSRKLGEIGDWVFVVDVMDRYCRLWMSSHMQNHQMHQIRQIQQNHQIHQDSQNLQIHQMVIISP